MNCIKYSGIVARVTAYTNAEVKIDENDVTRFIEREHYFEFTLVNSEWNKNSWIKVRFSKEKETNWIEYFKTYKPEDITMLGVEGELKTEVGFGSGFVYTYIEVEKVLHIVRKQLTK